MNYINAVSGIGEAQAMQHASLKLQKTQLILSLISVGLVAYSVLFLNKGK